MSVNESKITSVVFAIDTKDYSGNFEREMCAFVTGQVGECEVGLEFTEDAAEELKSFKWIEEHIVQEADDADSPCLRPCAIWPTPGRVNNGRGGHFDEDKISPEKCWGNHYWPAYESVAIFFDEIPPQDVIDEMIERAKIFALDRPDWMDYQGKKKPITITGFRVLTPSMNQPRKVVHTEVAKYSV